MYCICYTIQQISAANRKYKRIWHTKKWHRIPEETKYYCSNKLFNATHAMEYIIIYIKCSREVTINSHEKSRMSILDLTFARVGLNLEIGFNNNICSIVT